MEPQYTVTLNFVKAACDLDPAIGRTLWSTLKKLANDPPAPGLNVETLQGLQGVESARLNKGFRLVFRRIPPPPTFLLIDVGNHDDVYARAQRMPASILSGPIARHWFRDRGQKEKIEFYLKRGMKQEAADLIVEIRAAGFYGWNLDVLEARARDRHAPAHYGRADDEMDYWLEVRELARPSAEAESPPQASYSERTRLSDNIRFTTLGISWEPFSAVDLEGCIRKLSGTAPMPGQTP